MIRLTGRLICKDENEAKVVRAHLGRHIQLSRAEPGCLSFEVPQVSSLVWQVDESFVDQAAFDAHQTRTKASDWFRLTASIQREFRVWSD
jgi:quinol monooxygenase YgiN